MNFLVKFSKFGDFFGKIHQIWRLFFKSSGHTGVGSLLYSLVDVGEDLLRDVVALEWKPGQGEEGHNEDQDLHDLEEVERLLV